MNDKVKDELKPDLKAIKAKLQASKSEKAKQIKADFKDAKAACRAACAVCEVTLDEYRRAGGTL